MRLIRALGFCMMLMIFSLALFACEMQPLPDLSCYGQVTFNGESLENVVIKSDVKEFTTTNAQGEYSFTTKAKSMVVIPYLSGYMFEPASATLTEGENVANFIAIKIENLTGSLKLSKIIITPTSIISSVDNYQYLANGKECLKASDITVSHNGENYNLISKETYLNKSQKNVISVNQDIVIDCGNIETFGLLINTYFMSYYHEWKTSDSEYTNLYITKKQTNKDLKDGQITYNMYGINNKARSFTFDVAFVFDYFE